jgi:poly(3-hydroxybutyrate) depolymerase
MNIARSRGVRSALPALGCLAILLVAQVLHAQETKEKVTVDDVDRSFLLRLPKGYNAQQHYPVVILLHGMNQEPDDIERLTGFDQIADKDGIIAVYPFALHGRWNVGVRPKQHEEQQPYPGRHRRYGGGGYPGGGGGYPGGGGGGGYPGGGGGGYPGGGQQQPQTRHEESQPEVDDIGFFNQMIDQLTAKFSADPSRVYMAGLSEGGFMAMHIGCAVSDKVAAIATVGATMPKTMVCLPSRTVSLMMITGTSDPVVPHGGGTEKNLNLATLSADDSAKAWAKINHCSDKPSHSKLPAHGKGSMETKIDTYEGCGQSAQVVLYSVKGAGNTWPGGEQYEPENAIGKTSNDFSANEVIWNFLVTKKMESKSASGS